MAKEFNFKTLRLIQDNIPIITGPFTKNSFFKNGPVKLRFRDNFEKCILSVAPEIVPAFNGELMRIKLRDGMFNSEILEEFGDLKLFTIEEYTAVIRHLILKQLEGQSGLLLTNGHPNVFFIRLEDGRVINSNACWYTYATPPPGEWNLYSYGSVAGSWHNSSLIFSHQIYDVK